MSWDLNLCLDVWEKTVVPFHYFVKPKPQPTSPPSRSFFAFFSLPVDLQLMVYECCDTPTLFHLMQTSSRTRHAATKLFWENNFDDHWYHCLDYPLFAQEHNTYTIPRHCSEFASKITNIEIDLVRINFLSEADDEACKSTIAKAKDFWVKVERVFPSVRNVILAGCTPREARPPPPGELDEEYTTIETAVDCAPAHIKAHIAFVAFPNPERDRAPRHTLWKVRSREQPAWQVLDNDWKPTRVFLPNRKWTVSPLGDYKTYNQIYHSVLLESRGLEWLMKESYARYAMHDIIYCPRLDCHETFKQRVLWKQHLSSSDHGRFEIRHQSERNPMLQLFCYKHTPELEKEAIEKRQQRLHTHLIEAEKIERRVGHGWGPPRSEQRRLFEEEFLAQIRKESLYIPKEPGPECMSPDELYLDGLWADFSHSHIYHACSGTGEGHVCYRD